MGRKDFKFYSKTSFLKQNSGMTFVEVMMVVGILMILLVLSALALRPRFQLAKVMDARRKADLKTLSNALEDYVGDNPCYPEETEMNNCDPGTGLKPYLNKIPCDPQYKTPYLYVKLDCKKYVIYTRLEVEEEVVEYGVGNYAVSSSNLRIIPTVVVTPTAPPQPQPTATSGPTAQPTAVPSGPTPTIDVRTAFYGCMSGVCVNLPVPPPCSPSYQGYPDCDLGWGSMCGSPEDPKNECH